LESRQAPGRSYAAPQKSFDRSGEITGASPSAVEGAADRSGRDGLIHARIEPAWLSKEFCDTGQICRDRAAGKILSSIAIDKMRPGGTAVGFFA
jgi:hypothetical protein